MSKEKAVAEGWIAARCVDSNGKEIWSVPGHNVVVDGGRAYLFNRAFGSLGATTQGAYLCLHSASTASGQNWASVSASSVGGYATAVPRLAIGSAATGGSTSTTVGYSFTGAGPWTLSGANILFFTSTALATANLSSTGGIVMYNAGNFAASQQIVNGNSLTVSVTLSLGTA